jgi:hypothetical protein
MDPFHYFIYFTVKAKRDEDALFAACVIELGCSENPPIQNREKKRQEVNGRGEYSERSSLNSSNESIGKTGSSQGKCAKF